MKYFFHFLIIIFLTLLTQIGGVIYLVSLIFTSRKKSKYRLKRLLIFSFLYCLSTFIITPKIASLFGRVKIENNSIIESHTFFTILCNRNYVNPKLNSVLEDVSLNLDKNFNGIKLIYLDANFPFFDGFPLLPHLSHNDGKKIDITFIYEDENKKTINSKPSRSGYGVFETPVEDELNQAKKCEQKGFWQYDFTKYLTFGQKNKNLKLSNKASKKLIQLILNNNSVSKLFIEPILQKD